jgi:hypothetical protein
VSGTGSAMPGSGSAVSGSRSAMSGSCSSMARGGGGAVSGGGCAMTCGGGAVSGSCIRVAHGRGMASRRRMTLRARVAGRCRMLRWRRRMTRRSTMRRSTMRRSTGMRRRSTRVWGRRVLVLGESERRNRHHEGDQNMLPQGTFIPREFHRELLNSRNFHPTAKAPTCRPLHRQMMPMTLLEPGGRKAGKRSVRALEVPQTGILRRSNVIKNPAGGAIVFWIRLLLPCHRLPPVIYSVGSGGTSCAISIVSSPSPCFSCA